MMEKQLLIDVSHISNRRMHFFVIKILALLFFVVPSTTFAAVNLIPNSDFEIVNPTNPYKPDQWFTGYRFPNATSTYEYPVVDATGGKAVKVTTQTTAPGVDAKWYFSKVSVVPGEQYQFSDDYISTSTTEINVDFFDENQNHLSYGGYKVVPPTGDGMWGHVAVTFTVPAAARFAVVYHAITNGTLTLDNYSLLKTSVTAVPFSKGIVTFSFDDCWDSQFTSAVPKLLAAHLPASFYIITDTMNGENKSYMTTDTVLKLQEYGFEVSSHTVSHCNLATGLCPDGSPKNSADPLTTVQEIHDSRQALKNIGINQVDTFVYPYGAFSNPSTLDLVKDAGYLAARTTQQGLNNKSDNPYTLKTVFIGKPATEGDVSVIKAKIDQAIANKQWLIFMLHQVEPIETIVNKNLTDATSPEFLQQVIDYVQQKRDANEIVVKTLLDGFVDCMGTNESNCVNPPVNVPDTTAPFITVSPYTLTPTNQNIVVNASTNEGTLNATSKIFTTNGTFDFVATDEAGNVSTKTVTITNIDKIAPVITINPFSTSTTNQNVIVTASTNEGTLNSSTHTFTTNGSFNFIATDLAGNVSTKTVVISNIDKTAPVITISNYSTSPTNQNIVVTASTSKGTLNSSVHTFTTNGTFDFVATDVSGNVSSKTVTITNIDKTAPIITINPYIQTATNQDIVVMASANEGTLNPATHTFTVNGSFDFVATDTAGNVSTKTVTVTNIDKTAPLITLSGSNPQTVTLGTSYVEAGALASDNVDGDITVNITVDSSDSNINALGTYLVTYSVTDSAGNVAIPVTRTVVVEKRLLTITADSKTKVFGTTDPVLTYRITNGSLIPTDSIAGNLTRLSGENTGMYAIGVGTLFAGDNYTVTFVPANLTITAPVCVGNTVLVNNVCVTPEKPKSSGGGGGGGTPKIITTAPIITPIGTVLGASTTVSTRYSFVNTIVFGSRSKDVIELQTRLTNEGFYFGPITGYFGPLTQTAVRAYQVKNNLSVTGYVDEETKLKLNNKTQPTIQELEALLVKLQAELKYLLSIQHN